MSREMPGWLADQILGALSAGPAKVALHTGTPPMSEPGEITVTVTVPLGTPDARQSAALACGYPDWQALAHAVPPPVENCRVYWGSHGCDLPRGHERPCECDCCTCPPEQHPLSPEVTGYLCVAKPPYYGSDTKFYGEDVAARGLPSSE